MKKSYLLAIPDRVLIITTGFTISPIVCLGPAVITKSAVAQTAIRYFALSPRKLKVEAGTSVGKETIQDFVSYGWSFVINK